MGKIKRTVDNDVTFAEGCDEYILDGKTIRFHKNSVPYPERRDLYGGLDLPDTLGQPSDSGKGIANLGVHWPSRLPF